MEPSDFKCNYGKYSLGSFRGRRVRRNIQPPRPLTNLKNESFPNKAIYSSFRSVEPTDFKNAIQIKIQWAASEAADVKPFFFNTFFTRGFDKKEYIGPNANCNK